MAGPPLELAAAAGGVTPAMSLPTVSVNGFAPGVDLELVSIAGLGNEGKGAHPLVDAGFQVVVQGLHLGKNGAGLIDDPARQFRRFADGRALIVAFQVNHPRRVMIRQAEQLFGLFPPEE